MARKNWIGPLLKFKKQSIVFKVFKYSFYDLSRNYWNYMYFGFFLVITWILLYFSGDPSKILASMINIVLLLIPLITTVFGAMYFYNSREFIELLLAQPIKRVSIFTGHYFGFVLSLSMAFVLGTGIPFLFFGIQFSNYVSGFVFLIVSGVFLTCIFAAFTFLITINSENRIKGFGLAIFVWLFLTILYDGIFLLILFWFDDYPTEKIAIVLTTLNPIDLSRVLIMLDLDISSLMGYTGAAAKKLLGNNRGIVLSIALLVTWTIVPFMFYLRSCRKKDF